MDEELAYDIGRTLNILRQQRTWDGYRRAMCCPILRCRAAITACIVAGLVEVVPGTEGDGELKIYQLYGAEHGI